MNAIEIRKRNIELGITVKDWADCLGVSIQHAYRKLNGVSPLTLAQADKIQQLLKIDDSDFALYFLSGRSRIS